MKILKQEKIKLLGLLLLGAVIFVIGYLLGFQLNESKPEETISKQEAEQVLAGNNIPDPSKEKPELLKYNLTPRELAETITLKENSLTDVFGDKKITTQTFEAEKYPEYSNYPNQVSKPGTPDKLYITTYGSANYWKKVNKGSSLGEKDRAELLIQTYTRPETGYAYSGDNFRFYPQPLKLAKGNYAYLSQYEPPSAIVYLRKKKKFIVLTAKNEKLLLKALVNLKL